MYFETIEAATKNIADIVGHKVETDYDSLSKALDRYVEEQDDDDIYYSLHEFEEVEY